MAKREYAYFVAAYDKAIQRHIARAPIGNHELAQVAFHPATDQRIRFQVGDRGGDRRDGVDRARGVLLAQERERGLDFLHRPH